MYLGLSVIYYVYVLCALTIYAKNKRRKAYKSIADVFYPAISVLLLRTKMDGMSPSRKGNRIYNCA